MTQLSIRLTDAELQSLVANRDALKKILTEQKNKEYRELTGVWPLDPFLLLDVIYHQFPTDIQTRFPVSYTP